MPMICYIPKNFSTAREVMIAQANEIIAEYQVQGFVLTLRQLFYQFIVRGLLGNTFRNYKRMGNLINDGRLAGRIDWDAIEDRTRSMESVPHWADPQDILREDAEYFRLDKWADQAVRPEVWIEKEALAGVFERICRELDVSFLCCRGYTSQSIVWQAAQRHIRNCEKHGQEPIILHFGDHDPSGLNMTQDNTKRLRLFIGKQIEVRRMALNMDQVEEYGPPPNYAKPTDSRYAAYKELYGDESWELDALEPSVLAGLVETAVLDIRDDALWATMVEQEERHRDLLADVAERWEEVEDMLS